MKVVVVYYSLTGTTRKLARRLSETLGCDLVELPMFGTRRLDGGKKYDLAIVGTPIWLYAPAFPVSRFLAKNRDRLPAVAFFCTYQTTIGKSFEKMARKCGKEPLGTLKLTGPEIDTAVGDTQIKAYMGRITGMNGKGKGGEA